MRKHDHARRGGERPAPAQLREEGRSPEHVRPVARPPGERAHHPDRPQPKLGPGQARVPFGANVASMKEASPRASVS
eukprot:2259180-Prymnesium_polylepis.1